MQQFHSLILSAFSRKWEIQIFQAANYIMNFFPFRLDESLSLVTSAFWPMMCYFVINAPYWVSAFFSTLTQGKRMVMFVCIGDCLLVLWPWGWFRNGDRWSPWGISVFSPGIYECGNWKKCVVTHICFTHIPIIKTVEVSCGGAWCWVHSTWSPWIRNLHHFLKIWLICSWPKCTLGGTAPYAFKLWNNGVVTNKNNLVLSNLMHLVELITQSFCFAYRERSKYLQ